METGIATKIYLKSIFEEHLIKGDITIITDDFIRNINTIAMYLYNLDNSNMSPDDIEALKYLIMICNVLYNRTDMDKLPIEDGVYDLLLEKYKVFDSNFQVGAAVVVFEDKTAKEFNTKKIEEPLIFLEKRSNDPVNVDLRSSIMREGQPIYDIRDSLVDPLKFNPGPISKRLHNTAHEHPSLVGTLDKCKFVTMHDAEIAGAINDPNVKILERDFFQDHVVRGIINPNQKYRMCLELKYDGVSVEADCTDVVVSARSRGDTGIGEAVDYTPILAGYHFRRAGIRANEAPIGVKFEAIMTKSDLKKFCELKQYNYANCRTAIIGLVGSSDAYLYRDLITLVPLAVDRNDLPQIPNREVEIKFFNELYQTNCEPLRYCIVEGTVQELLFLIKKFSEEAIGARPYLNFMYDGIVVSYLDENIRETLGRENSINKYSMAVKFDPMKKMTVFRGYTFEVGQNGVITPMFHYDPVEFIGTIHTKCSGASLKRFKEIGLKYGDLIEVTYRNDVMPYVTKPDCEHNRANKNPLIEPPKTCPVCGTPLVITESGKSMVCPNMNCAGRKVARMTNMLAKLNLKGFAESTIVSLGVYTLSELVNLQKDYLVEKLGVADGASFYNTITRFKTEPIPDYRVMGALGFSNIAGKTWEIILQRYTIEELLDLYDMDEIFELEGLPGIGGKTIDIIISEFPSFYDDIVYISMMSNILVSKGSKEGPKIRFTGCRNKQLEELLCNLGYDADSNASVTKDTAMLIVPSIGYNSSKTTKMVGYGKGDNIVPISELLMMGEELPEYLNTYFNE